MDNPALLSIRNVSKTFSYRSLRYKFGLAPVSKVQALRNVSFDVPPGRITALLGPNGAGKTTLINIICDLVRADSGSVTVNGVPVPERASEAQRQIGVTTTNERSFFWRLSGQQNLEFFGALQNLPRSQTRHRTVELISRFGLEAHADRLFRFYSTGMKKRLALARCMLHDPQVLLLDEPTSGLDPAATDDLLDLVRTQFAGSGRCVLWATHRMDEVAKLCDDVVLLVDGEIRFKGTVAEFKDLAIAESGFRIELEARASDVERITQYAHSIGAQIERRGGSLHLRLPAVQDVDQFSDQVRKLIELGAGIRRLEPELLSLNQVFIRVSQTPVHRSQHTIGRDAGDA